jgi:hypothetical protein
LTLRLTDVLHLLESLIELGVGQTLALFDPLTLPGIQLSVSELLLQTIVIAELRIRRDRFEIVEIEKHRRMLSGSDEKILEIPERVLPEDVSLIARDIPTNRGLAGEYVEVILPEIDHHFLKLTFGIHRTKNAIRSYLREDLIGGPEIVFAIQRLQFLTALALLIGGRLLFSGHLRRVTLLRVTASGLRLRLSAATPFELA